MSRYTIYGVMLLILAAISIPITGNDATAAIVIAPLGIAAITGSRRTKQ